jgi:exosortase K
LIIFFKLLARFEEVSYLLWLLSPTAWLLEVYLNEPLTYVAGKGYVALNQPFVVSAECAGINFLIISFLSAVVGFLHIAQSGRQVMQMLACFLGLAYLLTITVNVFRIVNILHFEASWSVFLGLSPQVVHEMQGVLVYVSFLLAFYFLLGFVIKLSNQKHEKFS